MRPGCMKKSLHQPIESQAVNEQSCDPDTIDAEWMAGQRDLSDEQADMMLAKRVLMMANRVADGRLLSEAIELARDNTLASQS
jgi:hypothetical protein